MSANDEVMHLLDVVSGLEAENERLKNDLDKVARKYLALVRECYEAMEERREEKV